MVVAEAAAAAVADDEEEHILRAAAERSAITVGTLISIFLLWLLVLFCLFLFVEVNLECGVMAILQCKGSTVLTRRSKIFGSKLRFGKWPLQELLRSEDKLSASL